MKKRFVFCEVGITIYIAFKLQLRNTHFTYCSLFLIDRCLHITYFWKRHQSGFGIPTFIYMILPSKVSYKTRVNAA